jgi:hypothetical protein
MIMVSPPPTPVGGRSSSSSARSKWRRAQLMVAVTNSFRDAGKEGSERRAEAAAKAKAKAETDAVEAAAHAAARVRRVSSVERMQRAERLDQNKAKLRRVVAKVKAVNRFKLMADTSGNGKAGTVRFHRGCHSELAHSLEEDTSQICFTRLKQIWVSVDRGRKYALTFPSKHTIHTQMGGIPPRL